MLHLIPRGEGGARECGHDVQRLAGGESHCGAESFELRLPGRDVAEGVVDVLAVVGEVGGEFLAFFEGLDVGEGYVGAGGGPGFGGC